MKKEMFFKIVEHSPVPCIWFSCNDLEDVACGIKIIGYNNVFKTLSKKTLNYNDIYDLNLLFNREKLLNLKTNGDKIFKTMDYISLLNDFYEIEIINVEGNVFAVWFSNKIDLDKGIKTILDTVGVYTWLKDVNGRYIYLNRGFDEFVDIEPNSIKGKTDFDIYPTSVAEIINEQDQELLKGQVEYKEFISCFGKRCINRLIHLVRDSEGEIIGIAGLAIDTNEISKFMDIKISDGVMLNLISDTIPDSIFVKDIFGVFRHCNDAFAVQNNLSKDYIIGKTEDEINTSKEKIAKYKQEENEIIRTKKSIMTSHSKVGIDGRRRHYETIKVPFLDENQYVGGVLGISRDISHRKEAELEFERLRMEFFANLSHEFRTPLNLIFSSIQLLELMIERNQDSKNYITYTNIIKQNGYRLLKMVNNLIDSTRLNVGCIDYNPSNYNIVEFIENICDSVQNYVRAEGISLIFDTELEEQVMAFDFEKMERIMLNILSNAIKYNKENGDIFVNISFKEDKVCISVKDSGIGIPEDKLEDIFELFKQVNNRITKISEGSGIGLSIVKSLVDLHNGTIAVKSEKGIGSEFIIEIPISICEESEQHRNTLKYNKYVENIDIEFSDIYSSIK